MLRSNRNTLDPIGWKLLRELQHDGRASVADLARRVGLTPPAVSERLRRLEEAGVVRGYRAELDLKRLGLPVQAFVRLSCAPNQSPDAVAAALDEWPEVHELHRVTGTECFVARIALPEVEALEPLLDRMRKLGSTTTSLVLSSPITRRLVGPGRQT